MNCKKGGVVPSLHHRKEGWLRHQENFAQPPTWTQPGWFSFVFQSENHPGFANQWMLRDIFCRSATPPCGDARRGLFTLDSNSFTPSMTAGDVEFSMLSAVIDRRYSAVVDAFVTQG